MSEHIKAINEAVAKSKKADIILSKVVPIYNKEKYLPLALRSVQKQSLKYIYRQFVSMTDLQIIVWKLKNFKKMNRESFCTNIKKIWDQ